jgi:hypothetical protein
MSAAMPLEISAKTINNRRIFAKGFPPLTGLTLIFLFFHEGKIAFLLPPPRFQATLKRSIINSAEGNSEISQLETLKVYETFDHVRKESANFTTALDLTGLSSRLVGNDDTEKSREEYLSGNAGSPRATLMSTEFELK